MPGLIPENILEDILGRIDIVEVISGYIPLKRAGRNFKACCPFHQEKTPSFMVSADRQIYHCFGCGESGNAFKFLMRHERLEFPEAVELLAKKAGVSLPRERVNDKSEGIYTQLYRINELACLFFNQNLSAQAGQAALSYLTSRKITEGSVNTFKLGLALDKWDALIDYLRGKSINLALIEKAGLVLAKDRGGFYDRFRNRIIFPIHDIKSRVLGFGARIFSPGDETGAKYINSPETSIYIKGRNLYGLNLAKDAIRDADFAVIVEGYLDFILPYQEGFKNIVASSGTALTPEQVSLLKRYTNNAVMVYDGDKAGQMATLRNLDIFIEQGMSVKVVSLPEGYDPDLFVRKFGIGEFRKRVDEAQNLFDYKLKIGKIKYNHREIEGKVKISQEMLSTIDKFKNAVLKSEYVKKLAEELNLKEEPLLQELGKIKDLRPAAPAFVQKKPLQVNPTESLLAQLLLEENELIGRVKNNLLPEDFQDKKISKIISVMFDLIQQGKEIGPNKLANYLDDKDSLQFICESAFDAGIYQDNKEEVIDDCIKLIKRRNLDMKKKNLQEEIRAAEEQGDETALSRLRQEFCSLIKKV